MTVTELIEFLSAQPLGAPVKTWSPETEDYEEVIGAVWSLDGVLFFQTSDIVARLQSSGRDKLHAEAADKITMLRSLLRMHRCKSDGSMTVAECIDSGRCGCSDNA